MLTLAVSLTPDVRCLADPTQGYALYLPSQYSPDRAWPLLLVFDPRARGALAAERFVDAAETYGWIIAASNNSRNGAWEVSAAALTAMTKDLLNRHRIDERRIYAAGMSGGARVATQIAFGTGRIAGVIAASAGYPDSQPRKSIPFPLYGTAGTEDFNWLEMKQLDHALKSPHRVRIFDGGHVWLPKELAQEAIEWLELAAMRTNLRPLEKDLIAALYSKREAAAKASSGPELWRHIAEDFDGLDDRAAQARQTAITLAKEKSARQAARKEQEEMDLEQNWRNEIATVEAALKDPVQRPAALEQLTTKINKLATATRSDKDTIERRAARRLARGINSVATDPQYRKILEDSGLRALNPFGR